MPKTHVIALLLSGGAGTRLWPMSTADTPKQFLKIFHGQSLFQKTLVRLAACGVADVVVVANETHEAILREQAAEVGAAEPTIVLEPVRRDSGPAIAAGVAEIARAKGPGAIVLVAPCDHLIPSEQAFAAAIAKGRALAAAGFLGTFGVEPRFPSSEFGYIQRGEAIAGLDGAFRVTRFHEKPRRERAEAYLKAGGHDWNSGMFMFSVDTFAHEAELHMPEVWRAVRAAVANATVEERTTWLEGAAFESSPKISIDYALYEKSDHVGVIPVDFDWSDVGTWAAVKEAWVADGNGNTLVGDVKTVDSENNLIISQGVQVAAIGVHGLAIIATPDGVLVSPLPRAAEIKAMLAG